MKIYKTMPPAAKGLAFACSLMLPMAAVAGPYGYDLHNVLSPKAAGMAGTTIAGPGGGPVEAIYGNPANLADFYAARTGQTAGTQFTFGATLYHPEAIAKHGNRNAANPRANAADNPCITCLANFVSTQRGDRGAAFRERSQAESYAVPQIGFTQDLSGVGIPVVLGGGLSAVSGIGVDWRSNPNALGVGAEFIVLGINLGAGYEVTPALDVGFAATISYAMIEAGLAGTSGQAHDYGIRGTLGIDYHLTDSTDLGLYIQSELRHNWNDFVLLSNTPLCVPPMTCAGPFDPLFGDPGTAQYSDLDIEQPANLAFGVSHQFTDDIRIAADVIYKRWSEAAFWERIYHDQTAFSIGGEYDMGPWTFRAGYGYANDPNRNTPKGGALEGNDYICTGSPGHGTCLPLIGGLGTAVWSWVQAMEGPVIYEHRVTAGFTYHGFLAPFLDLDVHVAHQMQEDRDYSVPDVAGLNFADHTELDVQSWHGGFALTWKF